MSISKFNRFEVKTLIDKLVRSADLTLKDIEEIKNDLKEDSQIPEDASLQVLGYNLDIKKQNSIKTDKKNIALLTRVHNATLKDIEILRKIL